MLKNQHESRVNYYFQPYLSYQLIFIEVILASMKGLRQWPLSLCWGSGSVWGIYFLLSSFLLLLVPGQSSLFMDVRVFVQVDGFATVENSLSACITVCSVFIYSCNVLLTHCSMSLLSAEPRDHRKTKHSREGRRGWSTVCVHDRSSVYTTCLLSDELEQSTELGDKQSKVLILLCWYRSNTNTSDGIDTIDI